MFVNPFGGKKSAKQIFEKEVKPLFEDADIYLDVQGSRFLPLFSEHSSLGN